MGRPQKPPGTANEMYYRELESKGELDPYETEVDKKAYADQKFASLSFYEKGMYKLQHKQAELKFMNDIAEYLSKVPEFLRPTVMASIEKRYKHAIVKLEQPGGAEGDEVTKSPKKRKAANEDEETAGPSSKKAKKKKKGEDHPSSSQVLNEIEEAKDSQEDQQGDESAKKKKKKKKKSKADEN